MPGAQTIRRRIHQIIHRESPAERYVRSASRFQVGAEVLIHELGRVGLVNREAVKVPVGIVNRDIEWRSANKRGQPGNQFGTPGFLASLGMTMFALSRGPRRHS